MAINIALWLHYRNVIISCCLCWHDFGQMVEFRPVCDMFFYGPNIFISSHGTRGWFARQALIEEDRPRSIYNWLGCHGQTQKKHPWMTEPHGWDGILCFSRGCIVFNECTGQVFSSVSCFLKLAENCTLMCFDVWCNFSFKLKRALLELNHDIVPAGALDVG